MSTDKQRSRSARKGLITKETTQLDLIITECNYEDMVAEREIYKDLYKKFRKAHDEYHDTLSEESHIESSECYLEDVQKKYTLNLRKLNAAIDEERADSNTVPMKNYKHDCQNESLQALAHLVNLPPLKIETFSGSPDDFDTFITTFDLIVGRVTKDSAAKLIRLKSHVSGIAAEAIKSCRTQDGEQAYTRAINILRERFGSPYIVCHSIISKLKNGGPVRTPSELQTFADDLANAEVTLKGNDMFSEIDTQYNIVQICHRLQPQLRYKWRDIVMNNKRATALYLKFSDFVSFVQDRADDVNDPIYGEDSLVAPTDRLLPKKSTTGYTVSTDVQSLESSSTEYQPRQTGCYLCKGNHQIEKNPFLC